MNGHFSACGLWPQNMLLAPISQSPMISVELTDPISWALTLTHRGWCTRPGTVAPNRGWPFPGKLSRRRRFRSRGSPRSGRRPTGPWWWRAVGRPGIEPGTIQKKNLESCRRLGHFTSLFLIAISWVTKLGTSLRAPYYEVISTALVTLG